MAFTRPEFLLLFLPLALLIWWSLQRAPKAAQWALVALSSVFYALWDIRFLGLLIALTLVNYWFGLHLAKATWSKGRSTIGRFLLVCGIALNLAVLGFFKYTNWAYDIAAQALHWDSRTWSIVLPLGISFFAFQKIAFLVDCYNGKVHHFSFRKFAAFVSFFPQLIAGPITHHTEVIEQLTDKPKALDEKKFVLGLLLLLLGLTKKIWLADSLAPISDRLFEQAGHAALTLAQGWTAALAYSGQLYLDFSGYADMAIGMGLMFGIALPTNFNAPYQAVTIADFWRRWHMTLSRFLRDYLYIPLGGNRHGFARGLAAAFMTMLLGGLWHGAAFTFILWGALHGLALCIHRIWMLTKVSMPTLVSHALTLVFVIVAWVPFRANSLDQTLAIWRSMLGGSLDLPPMHLVELSITLGSILTLASVKQSALSWAQGRLQQISTTWRPALMLAGLASFGLYRSDSFIYWSF